MLWLLEIAEQGHCSKSNELALTKFVNAKISKQAKTIKIERSQRSNRQVKNLERAVWKWNSLKRKTIEGKTGKRQSITIEDHKRKIGERKSIEIDIGWASKRKVRKTEHFEGKGRERKTAEDLLIEIQSIESIRKYDPLEKQVRSKVWKLQIPDKRKTIWIPSKRKSFTYLSTDQSA